MEGNPLKEIPEIKKRIDLVIFAGRNEAEQDCRTFPALVTSKKRPMACASPITRTD